MQSLASLMSVKQSDVGNLDDFNDSDDEASEERRAISGTGPAAHGSGKTFENTCGLRQARTKYLSLEDIKCLVIYQTFSR